MKAKPPGAALPFRPPESPWRQQGPLALPVELAENSNISELITSAAFALAHPFRARGRDGTRLGTVLDRLLPPAHDQHQGLGSPKHTIRSMQAAGRWLSKVERRIAGVPGGIVSRLGWRGGGHQRHDVQRLALLAREEEVSAAVTDNKP